MDNVTKRSLQAEMGDAFMGWAEGFFASRVSGLDGEEGFMYLDDYFSKEKAFEEFKKATSQTKWLVTKFKKALVAYCKYNGYIFNPKELHTAKGRIIQKLDGKSEEVIFIRTIPIPEVFNQAENVTEYQSEEEVFNEEE